jgi:sugar lactone lactonase YvrE
MSRNLLLTLVLALSVGAWAQSVNSSSSASATAGQTVVNRIGGLTVDLSNGALYVADKGNSTILRIGPAGKPAPFAGTGSSGFNGDGQTALQTQFNHAVAISYDQRTSELFVADTGNYRIRSISPADSRVRTVAGLGSTTPVRNIPYDSHTPGALAAGRFGGDGGPATEAELNLPSGVCADPIGILFIADSGNHRVRAVNRGTSPVIVMGVEIEPGTIRTIAGTGKLGFSGDGDKATLAELAFPTELKVDASGSLMVVDSFNQRVRKIDRQSGIIHTIVDGSIVEVPPDNALLHWATSVAGVGVTMTQEIIYTDRVTNTVHRVSRGGQGRIIYNTGLHDAEFGTVEVGPQGEIYVADVHWNRVLRIDGSTARTYLGGAPGPVLSFPGVRRSSGTRTE